MNNCRFFIVLSRKDNSVVVEKFTITMTYLALRTELRHRPRDCRLSWSFDDIHSTEVHDYISMIFFYHVECQVNQLKSRGKNIIFICKEALWNNLFNWHSIGCVTPGIDRQLQCCDTVKCYLWVTTEHGKRTTEYSMNGNIFRLLLL